MTGRTNRQLLTLPEFVARWQGSKLTERSAAQSHFSALCDVLGRLATEDRAGASQTVHQPSGNKGIADVKLKPRGMGARRV